MKEFERKIFVFQENHFFAPIRNKVDYIKVLMYACRSLLLDMDNSDYPYSFKFRVVVEKMSRLFIYKVDRFISMAFPFIITSDETSISIQTYSGNLIDNKIISAILSLLANESYIEKKSLIDVYIEPGSIETSGIFILEELIHFEPGYVRYDYDKENENGALHPLNHIDFNYSQYSQIKLGLKEKMTEPFFEDFHNLQTNCRYLD